MLIYFLLSLKALIFCKGEFFIFDSEKNYLKSGDKKIFFEQNFYNAYEIKFDFILLYILSKEGLYVINPVSGKILSFYKFKRNYSRFTKDDKGNFYFLDNTLGKIKVINFTRRDSFYLDFSPSKNVLSMEYINDKLYFLYPDKIVSFDIFEKKIQKEADGKWDGFKKFDLKLFLWKENCIKIKNDEENTFCINSKIDDLIFLKDTIFILTSDSILKIPFKEVK
ncbi:MAG: hypothetical protein ABIM60_00410 [candidate division WOR-3 bacterium]